MARSRIATGLEKLMSDLPKLMLQRNLAESAQMKQLSIQATEGYLKEAANFTTEAQFDSAAASMMDELGQHGNDPTIAMAGNNAFKALGRLKENFINKQEGVVALNPAFPPIRTIFAPPAATLPPALQPIIVQSPEKELGTDETPVNWLPSPK